MIDISKMVFVFGSNEGGRHGAGAAKYAANYRGAEWGKGYGHWGSSFAIPTMNQHLRRLPLETIRRYVDGFLRYAGMYPTCPFQVTQIGCGLAGWTKKDIAPLFVKAPSNCWFDEAWKPWLGTNANYWGTM